MAKGICPNLSDPQIKAEFDEMVAALGEKQAYAIWDMNNGYSLDKAPNGEPSVLFSRLLEYNNDNRQAAIQDKAKIYTNSFIERYGNWIEGEKSDKFSYVEGEPIVSKESLNIFDKQDSPLQQQSMSQIDEAMKRFRAERYDFDKTLDTLRQLITNAVQARIKSIQNRKIANKTALLVPLEQQLSALKNPNIDSLQTIVYCLSDIKRTMTRPVNAILTAQKNLREGRDSGFSNLALIQLQQDYFGMYNNVLEEIARNVFDSDIYKDILGAQSFDQMKTMISNMRTQFAAARQGLIELTTDLAQKTMLKYGIKDEQSRTELEQYVGEDLITTENDVSSLMRWIGSGDKMNDKAARVMFDMIANTNNKTRFATHKFGNKLLRLQKQISLGDQMRLFEYDSDGKKTGYFIRDRKYGEFLNNLEKERKRLKTKYNVPEGQNMPLDKEARTAFKARIA